MSKLLSYRLTNSESSRQSSAIQCICLSLKQSSVYSPCVYSYAMTLLASVIPLQRPGILTLLSIASVALSFRFNALELIVMCFLGLVHLVVHRFNMNEDIHRLHLRSTTPLFCAFIYLIAFSVISLAQQPIVHNTALVILYIMLIIFSLVAFNVLKTLVLVANVISALWGFGSYLVFCDCCDWLRLGLTDVFVDEAQWFYVGVSVSIWAGSILRLNLQEQSQIVPEHPLIEMQDMTHNDSKEQDCIEQDESNGVYSKEIKRNLVKSQSGYLAQKQESRIMAEKQGVARPISEIPNIQEPSPSIKQILKQLSIWSQYERGQAEVLNIFLLLPFTLFHRFELQLPLYIYIFMLQYNRTPLWMFYIMFLSICYITFMANAGLPLQFLLRICLIFTINKNFQLVVNITRVFRALWLRSSFIVVLLLFFWFSLLTVNVFHIVFVIIVLLFITKQSGSEEKLSFRHQNWKYLMMTLDVFIALRYCYCLLIKFGGRVPPLAAEVLNVLGVSYSYLQNFSHFNLIPLLICGVITIQFWTYSSRIYSLQSRSRIDIDSAYRRWIERMVTFLKIIYYKLVPWCSNFVVLGILIKLEFSCISGVVILWSLATLWTQMVRPNQLHTYRVLNWRWMILMRMLAVQAILRYIFEFVKFPLIYTRVQNLPIIRYLLEYQEIVGLLIRESSTGYLSNIFTKFQIMIALDFTLIAICFLVIEYYEVLIKYKQSYGAARARNDHAADTEPQLEPVPSYKEVYEKYIDFKLIDWLSSFHRILLLLARIFLKLYFLILGTYCCIVYSYASFFYFCCCLYYYLRINLNYFQLDVVNEHQKRIADVFEEWKKNVLGDNAILGNQEGLRESQFPIGDRSTPVSNFLHSHPDTRQQLKSLYNTIAIDNRKQAFHHLLDLHLCIRPLLLLGTLLFILMTYSSRMLHSGEISNLLRQETIDYMRYLFFLMGISSQSMIGILPYILIVLLTVVEIKCCSLMAKLRCFEAPLSEIDQTELEHIFGDAFDENSEVDQASEYGGNLQSSHIHNYNPPLHESLHSEIQRNRSTQLHRLSARESKKVIDMQISLRMGLNKLLERMFVIFLVFVSILEDQNPFSIIYLCLAWLLNYMGNNSIKTLMYSLSFLVLIEYTLIITDTHNPMMRVQQLFPENRHLSWLILVLNVQDEAWIAYLRFGYTTQQLFVLYFSLIILVLYELCFFIEELNWKAILKKILEENVTGLSKFYEKFTGIYQYAFVYSPLCITILCLGLYFLDFTATNMFLSIMSIIFLYKSFLFQNYTESREFWKSYFRILQLLIVIFMVVYCLLSTPMYQKYCHPILCSKEQFRTKVTKTMLLLILQVGIDLISNHHFIASMSALKTTLGLTSSYFKILIAIAQNNKRIGQWFRSIDKKQQISNKLGELEYFLSQLKEEPNLKFHNNQHIKRNEFWVDSVLAMLPSLIDSEMIMSPREASQRIKMENKVFIAWLQRKYNQQFMDEDLLTINMAYIEEFKELHKHEELRNKVQQIIDSQQASPQKQLQAQEEYLQEMEDQDAIINQSYTDPYERESACMELIQQKIRRSMRHPTEDNIEVEEAQFSNTPHVANKQEKKQMLYLMILESVMPNWHYAAYVLMVLQFINNMGILTAVFPFLTFCWGLMSSYQAPKTVWRAAFLALLPSIFIKFALSVSLIEISQQLTFLLIGSNTDSILLEFLLTFFIIVQCSILQIVGLYQSCTSQVQCMRMALLRKIINCEGPNQSQKRQGLYSLLQQSSDMSSSQLEFVFSKKQCKNGYDYSTIMVSVQLVIVFYIFCFYDKMAFREDLSFYKVIEYNQFTAGMVMLAFVQLGFILVERILAIVEFTNRLWDFTLIFKYLVLLASMAMVHGLVIVFFPINSGFFHTNPYILIFYVLYTLYFFVSALQIRNGVDKQSRGFMDRYTWYNGFVYMVFRVIPFLFEFKIFSDWTFTNTSLRLFDWIKFEEILGHLYVAKCNSLFMRGKILGSKIEWWKKLLMGFPLLLAIILLLFGPLVLFSSLNPLASLNEISGGYFELSLKINRTNEYPLYVNTHITDINFLNPDKVDQPLQQTIKSYELDIKSIQQVHLDSYSDQYWEISEGSYQKLMEEPEGSLYELMMRVRFERNFTGTTPVYRLNNYTILESEVPQFKKTLEANGSFSIDNFFPAFIRLDNNNGLHFLTDEHLRIEFKAVKGRNLSKKYWVIQGGIFFKVASDKYSKAIFGYSVMSFYISIILVVANYFRFLFQGSAYNIILSDIPHPDPLLSLCDGVHQARLKNDIYQEEIFFWTLIDIMRSPDTIKALTGDYLEARLETLRNKDD